MKGTSESTSSTHSVISQPLHCLSFQTNILDRYFQVWAHRHLTKYCIIKPVSKVFATRKLCPMKLGIPFIPWTKRRRRSAGGVGRERKRSPSTIHYRAIPIRPRTPTHFTTMTDYLRASLETLKDGWRNPKLHAHWSIYNPPRILSSGIRKIVNSRRKVDSRWSRSSRMPLERSYRSWHRRSMTWDREGTQRERRSCRKKSWPVSTT